VNWAVERHDLPLSRPFGISRGTSETSGTVVVELAHADTVGYGAVSPSSYYGETAETVAETVPDLLDAVHEVGDPHAGQRIRRLLREAAPDQPAARSAVGVAVADLAARDLGVPMYRQWGLDPDRVPPTSYTVSLDPPERMAETARAAVDAGFGTLKLKLGSDDDRIAAELAVDRPRRPSCGRDERRPLTRQWEPSDAGVSTLCLIVYTKTRVERYALRYACKSSNCLRSSYKTIV